MGTICNRFLSDVYWENPDVNIYKNIDTQVHIWRISISESLSLLNKFRAILNPGELIRAKKYHQQKHNNRFIISRAAQRIILSKYLNTPAIALDFVLGENKKPKLAGTHNICYNLSHSGNWILLAITTAEVGVDVEFIDTNFDYRDILPDNFSVEESTYVYEKDSIERFFTLWTRKEAILKATGQGLGEHIKVVPSLNGDFKMDSSLIGSDKNWQLNSFNVIPAYAAAVVAEGNAAPLVFYNADYNMFNQF